MEHAHISKSPSASVHWGDRFGAVALGGERTGIGFALDDNALAIALRGALLGRADLKEVGEADADVVVTDRDQADDGFASRRAVLRIGAGRQRDSLDTVDPGLILAAARVVAAGYRIEAQAEAKDRPVARLSARERQVAELLADGASNKVIARGLDISVHTAKFHVTAVMEKLGARNRADAVAILLREGLVSL